MFNYELDYKHLNLREEPQLYRVGRGEQGVLMVEPYKSELLPLWRFRNPEIAKKSAQQIYKKFLLYKEENDFIGMDMARKFIQMGYTRSRRYANHASGRKYAGPDKASELPRDFDAEKAQSARIFKEFLERISADRSYQEMKEDWKIWYG